MSAFNEQQICYEYDNCSYKKQKILNEIEKMIIRLNATLEGNCFYFHETLKLCQDLYPKQVNLFWCGKQAVTKICEIGFNAGHSAMLLLLGHDKSPLEFTIFDLDYHSYTIDCLKYIASEFRHVNINFIRGDSTVTMPVWIEKNKEIIGAYDVIHIDGCHLEEYITSDIKYADILLKVNGILIIDDTNHNYINNLVDEYISMGKYRELKVMEIKHYPHRILQKCENPRYTYY